MYIRWVLNTEPNPIFFIDNSDTDYEACSDVDDDYLVVDDSLLCDSVTYASGTTSTPAGRKQRTSVHFEDQGSSRTPTSKPVAQRTPAPPSIPARREVRANPAVHPTPTVSTPSQQVKNAPQSDELKKVLIREYLRNY